MKRRISGFSLLEVMVVVAIVGILTAIALPQYTDHVTRSRLTEAFTALGGVQANAEQYWANTRSYVGFTGIPTATTNFTYTLSAASDTAFTLTATGQGAMTGWAMTIDQSGGRATTAAPTGWGTSATCWVDHKGGTCSE